jgi:hypothetical protein
VLSLGPMHNTILYSNQSDFMLEIIDITSSFQRIFSRIKRNINCHFYLIYFNSM